jgi:hypothetical protein
MSDRHISPITPSLINIAIVENREEQRSHALRDSEQSKCLTILPKKLEVPKPFIHFPRFVVSEVGMLKSLIRLDDHLLTSCITNVWTNAPSSFLILNPRPTPGTDPNQVAQYNAQYLMCPFPVRLWAAQLFDPRYPGMVVCGPSLVLDAYAGTTMEDFYRAVVHLQQLKLPRAHLPTLLQSTQLTTNMSIFKKLQPMGMWVCELPHVPGEKAPPLNQRLLFVLSDAKQELLRTEASEKFRHPSQASKSVHTSKPSDESCTNPQSHADIREHDSAYETGESGESRRESLCSGTDEKLITNDDLQPTTR